MKKKVKLIRIHYNNVFESEVVTEKWKAILLGIFWKYFSFNLFVSPNKDYIIVDYKP